MPDSDVAAFETEVLRVLRRLPAGEVVTYGEVALEAGFPGRARAVGRILATTEVAVPWWRVVASNGRLVPDHEVEHAKRLRAEGVAINEHTGRVPMANLQSNAALYGRDSTAGSDGVGVTGRRGSGRTRRS